MATNGRPRQVERTVSKTNGSPAVTVTWQLEEAGLDDAESVNVIPKDGYVVVVGDELDQTDLEPTDRDNIPDIPVESAFEARLIGNRLWELGERYGSQGEEHIKEETQHLARRFHSFGKNTTGDNFNER